MALAAALMVLIAVLPAVLVSTNDHDTLTVTCKDENSSPQKTKVTAAGTVLTVECPTSWEIDPPVDKGSPKVCATANCGDPVPLSDYSKDAKAEAVEGLKPGIKITFGELLKPGETFHLTCQDGEGTKKCNVEVLLEKSTNGVQPEPSPGESGTPSVQICEPKASITVKIPEKGSTAQFACKSGFVLYPTLADKVFSKDCKTEETLPETSADGAGTNSRSETPKTTTYTLKADKKPSKKTLCYLCAKHEIRPPGRAEDYCTIYVESGARTQLNLNFTFVLALPCVFAAFQFT